MYEQVMSLLRLPWAARHRRPVTSAAGFTGELPRLRSASFLLSFVLPAPIRPRGGITGYLPGWGPGPVVAVARRLGCNKLRSAVGSGTDPTFFFLFFIFGLPVLRPKGHSVPAFFFRPRDPSIQLPASLALRLRAI